jgi:hypothetical protein
MSLVLSIAALAAMVLGATPSATGPEPATPATPREFFNAGTQQLRQGKLREAEAFLESALASQSDRLQPLALYNLGHVRFGQGVQELKKGPSAKSAIARGRAASDSGEEALREVEDALASDDLDKMVAAYMHGRGARKELKAATVAVRRALEAHGTTLAKWQRASDDFKSAVELKRPNPDAELNAETVDRSIAKLVDMLRELQQCSNGLGNKSAGLGQKLKQLKGRIPAANMPPGGGGGDDEEDEDTPFGPQPGQQEGPSKEGQEMVLSREQAGWLLDSFRLDGERRLPMGGTQEGQPKDRARPTW